MSTITIDVTDEDITTNRAERMSQGEICMVAEAVRRRLDLTTEHVDVGYSGITLFNANYKKRVSILHPKGLGLRIGRWDRGLKVKPFSFDVEFPDDWREQLKAK